MARREIEDKEVPDPVKRRFFPIPILGALVLTALLLSAMSCAPHRRGRIPEQTSSEPRTASRPATRPAETSRTASENPSADRTAPAKASEKTRADVVCAEALKHLGTKYVYGGSTPRGFDCSGLVQYCYQKVGVQLPRRAIDQSRSGKNIRLAQARRGDLIFFATQRGDRITHVGIYLGDDKFIHAPSRGKTIEVKSLDESSWYRKRIKRVRRVLPS